MRAVHSKLTDKQFEERTVQAIESETPLTRQSLKAPAHVAHASQRQIARTLGVDEGTIRGDLRAEFSAPPDSGITPVESTRFDDPLSDGSTEDRENTEQIVETDAENSAPTVYSTIVIDPPWPMQFIQRKSRPTQVRYRDRIVPARVSKHRGRAMRKMRWDGGDGSLSGLVDVCLDMYLGLFVDCGRTEGNQSV